MYTDQNCSWSYRDTQLILPVKEVIINYVSECTFEPCSKQAVFCNCGNWENYPTHFTTIPQLRSKAFLYSKKKNKQPYAEAKQRLHFFINTFKARCSIQSASWAQSKAPTAWTSITYIVVYHSFSQGHRLQQLIVLASTHRFVYNCKLSFLKGHWHKNFSLVLSCCNT